MAGNTSNIGFEKQIWDAACVLRGNIDASEYKSVVLGLIFLKYISDRFEAKYKELVEEGDGFEEDQDEYTAENIFFVPENARWSAIATAAHTPEIGAVIDDAMRSIEKENKRLKDILPKNFARPELDKRRLGEVVDLFTNIQMIEHGNSKDILGRTYEYCLSKFAEQEGKLAGEFYTPSCVVRTLVEVLQPFKNAAIIKYLTQAEIIFEYRSSEASGPANQREEFKIGFFACYDRVWELVNLRNDKQHYQEGFFVFDIATFNERVVREAILNAVSHRNYQFGGSIFVRQFRDRLVVESPGGLPFGITLDNILDRQLPRNRRIAEILSLCGMVERSGQGMNLMFELSVQEAKPLPDFTGTDDFFVSVTLNGLIIDKAMLSVINRISERGAELLSTEDFLVIEALYHERPLNEKMQSRLNRLIEMGIVEHIGRKKYVLARSLYAATGKTGVHTRHVGLDRDTNKELLLKHIRQNNEVGTPFKELQQVLPGLDRNQIRVLMRELRESGKVFCEGTTSAARWFASK